MDAIAAIGDMLKGQQGGLGMIGSLISALKDEEKKPDAAGGEPPTVKPPDDKDIK